jgi:hypothetical protein
MVVNSTSWRWTGSGLSSIRCTTDAKQASAIEQVL